MVVQSQPRKKIVEAKIVDIESFCEELKEVSSSKIMDKRKFHPAGLFSEQIFGPLKNYTCQCGTYYGVSKSGTQCEKCKVDIVNSNERRRRYAKITLPIKVVNPLMYDLLSNVAGSHLMDSIDRLMKNEKVTLYFDENGPFVSADPQVPETIISSFERVEAIYELVNYFAELYYDEDYKWKIIKNNMQNLLTDYVIVLPADLRPAAKGVEKNSQEVDKLNRYYQQIITKKESMRDTIININYDKQLYYNYYKQIQKDVFELYEHIMEKLSKKEGLLRQNILGKRVDFSGRAVISPEPSLKLDECYLPYTMILELYKLHISKRLINLGRFKVLNEAIDYVNNCIELRDPDLFEISKEVTRDELCILNRQPSLHRLSMLGFKIKVTLDYVIKLHPLVCSPFNADFDGDQMAVYVSITEESKKEILDKLIVTKNLINPANQKLSVSPSQDIILGLFALTSKLFPNLQNKVKYKNQIVSEDIKIFNDCLPENYPVIDVEITKNTIGELLNHIKNNYSDEETKVTLDNLKEVGFKYATLYGATMSLDAFNTEDYTLTRDDIYSSGTKIEQLIKISSKEVENLIKDNFKYSYLVSSGARGKWDQARQIILTRGFISNFNGDIMPDPVKNSLVGGLTQKEFFTSTYGCRKGLLDVAVNTGESGFLSRKLVFTCVNSMVSEDLVDCGSKDYLDIDVTQDKIEMILGKFFKDGDKLTKITKTNYKSLIGKTIQVRSPIFCNNEEICHTCYGDLYKHLHSKYAGIVAAQSLGETNTQLILRIFHTSGVAMIADENVDMKQSDIIGDLSSISKLLHVKDKGKLHENLSEFVHKLFSVYNGSRDIHHTHIEIVTSQMMWVNDEKWRLKKDRSQHIPQFYSVQTTPEKESWILGLGFSYPKKNIMRGIMDPGKYTGIMDDIIRGKRLC